MKKDLGQKSKRKSPEMVAVPNQETGTKVETGNNILDSLFNGELTNLQKYDQQVVSIVKRHLAKKEPSSKAGTKLAEELLELAKSSLAELAK